MGTFFPPRELNYRLADVNSLSEALWEHLGLNNTCLKKYRKSSQGKSSIVVAMEIIERRKSKRFEVSILCFVEWEQKISRGHITDLSLRGALITQVDFAPPDDALVQVEFEFDQQDLELAGVVSRIVYSRWGKMGDRYSCSFGVEFERIPSEIQSKLNSILHSVSQTEVTKIDLRS
jgi:hypothetical protein